MKEPEWAKAVGPKWAAVITVAGYGFVVWAFREPLGLLWERLGYWSPIAIAAIIGLALVPLGPIAWVIGIVLAIGFVFGPIGIGAAILLCLILILSRK